MTLLTVFTPLNIAASDPVVPLTVIGKPAVSLCGYLVVPVAVKKPILLGTTVNLIVSLAASIAVLLAFNAVVDQVTLGTVLVTAGTAALSIVSRVISASVTRIAASPASALFPLVTCVRALPLDLVIVVPVAMSSIISARR